MTEIEARIELAIDAKFNWLKPLICLSQFTVFSNFIFLIQPRCCHQNHSFFIKPFLHIWKYRNKEENSEKGKKSTIRKVILENPWILIFYRSNLYVFMLWIWIIREGFCKFAGFFFNMSFFLHKINFYAVAHFRFIYLHNQFVRWRSYSKF